MQRFYFPVAVNGGVTYQNTSPSFSGEISQIRWQHDADTGQVATFEISLHPETGDTGTGFAVYQGASGNVAASFIKSPRQFTHNVDGSAADTGEPEAPFVAHGDHLQVKVVPADTGVVIDGKLFVWASQPTA